MGVLFDLLKSKKYLSEEEILFYGAPYREYDPNKEHPGTTFAGSGKVCSESLTPNPAKANRLRTQKYW